MNKIIEVVERDALLQNVLDVGEYLINGFTDLEKEFDHEFVTASRGRGLFLAFDVPNGKVRDQVVQACFSRGLLIGGCGDRTIRMRPALNFTRNDASQMLDVIRSVCHEVK